MAEEEAFGAGIALDENWDLVVDGSGDLDYEFGYRELEKDLAFQTATELENELGRPITDGDLASYENTVYSVLFEEERITSIEEVTVTKDNTFRNEINISVTVTADDNETYDFIYTL